MGDTKMQEKELRKQAIQAAIRYYEFKHRDSKPFAPGDRIPYAGRVFDEKEISNLIDASLDFWLTTGRFAERFEKEFADFLGVQHCSLVNSGSSANLLAFMALTSPKLGERRILPGDDVISVAAASNLQHRRDAVGRGFVRPNQGCHGGPYSGKPL